ncbi:hypothetical protein CD113_05515 [Staphylococcus simiae]|uniref:Uncharacterized protein n=1 Tax=Staphylococcus simiae CCM 7213 = CCUG 51256 TaxID=911238 RepID=G5JJA4_9STAP|nr:hypothetical protein SS7213T_07787 [Staphylococcus simiae CCM 7213 = CCUG 51256]PNZ13285.1 hypothetical protein CD113_05515 [Staphylococcus simiae]
MSQLIERFHFTLMNLVILVIFSLSLTDFYSRNIMTMFVLLLLIVIPTFFFELLVPESMNLQQKGKWYLLTILPYMLIIVTIFIYMIF